MRRSLARLGDGDWRIGAGLAAVLLATAITYSRAIRAEFVGDDWDLIVNNRYLKDWSFISKSLVNDVLWFHDPLHAPYSLYYRPLHDIWLAINFHLFGFHPAGWHLASIALGLLAVWQVFRVGSRVSGDRLTGLLAAALFGLMPIHAQAIAWPAAVCQPLVAIFELGAFECYLRWNAQRRPSRDLALSMGLFAGALLTYESAVVFPVLVAAHAFLLGSDRSYKSYRTYAANSRLAASSRDALAAAWPYAVEVAAYLALRFWVLGFISATYRGYHLSAREAALTIPGALASYAMLLLMPWRAAPAHRLAVAGSIAAPGFYVPLLALAAVCAAGFLALRHNPRRRLYLFCAAWIPIALAPMLNLNGLLAQAVVQDRYLYLPSFGFCLLAADLAVTFAYQSDAKAIAVWIGAGALLIAYAALQFGAERYWHDDVAMYSDFSRKFPQVDAWHYQLGKALAVRGDFADARREIETALRLAPNADARVLHDLALVDERLGDRTAAMHTMDAALKRDRNPSPESYAEFALAADAAGDSQASNSALARAENAPGGGEIAALARAQILFRHRDTPGAEHELQKLLAHDPDNERALATLGAMLSSEHRYGEALAMYRRAAQSRAYDPSLHYLTALALHRLGRDGAARAECAAALRAAPDDSAAIRLMAEIERSGAP